jgi:hypothetical protein
MKKIGLVLTAAFIGGLSLAAPSWAVDRTANKRLAYRQRPFFHKEPRYVIEPWRYEFHRSDGKALEESG